jgi:hypothetical protein
LAAAGPWLLTINSLGNRHRRRGELFARGEKRERAEAAKDRLARTNELKTAAGLTVDNFFIAQLAATEFVEKKRWVPGTARNFLGCVAER